MKRFSSPRAFSLVVLLAIMGAGCDAPGIPSVSNPNPVARTMGFGTLPRLESPAAPRAMDAGSVGLNRAPVSPAADAPLGSPEAISMRPMGMMADPGSVGSGVAGTPSSVTRPIPSPVPNVRPVTVEYVLEGSMPSWESQGEVFQRQVTVPDKNAVLALAAGTGLPSELTRSVESITMLNLQWKDAEKYQWTYDVSSHTLNFWKEMNAVPPTDLRTQPEYKKDEVMAIAGAFLDRHGFSSIRAQGGEVEEAYGIMPMDNKMMGVAETSMPCLLREEAAASGPVSGDAAVVSPMIYPSPCGWWSPQVTVFYGGKRDGLKVTDMWGNVYRSGNIIVNLQTKQVVGGYVQLDETVVGSSYALIDLETAQRRLQSGGRNPVYPWGSEDGNIKVTIKTIELAWMRYDVWAEGASEVYYLPALFASGSVQRGKNVEVKEEYRTALPLVRDDAFDDQVIGGPEPMPLSAPASPPKN